jgi:hypothetical protein
MTNKQIEKLMSVLLVISAFLILIGAFFKLLHYPNGNLILWIGFVASFVLSSFEISRLKKIIKKLENKIQ